LFVEEENDGYRPEPPVIPNGFEKVKGLAQPVLTRIFAQDHVVRGARRHKDDGRHVVEALNPFAPLVPLSAHVEHAKKMIKEMIYIKESLKNKRKILTGS